MSGQQSSWWGRIGSGSKTGFDKAWKAVDKLGAPVNRLSNKLGSEAFWPTTLDKESDKAARILRSFCKDGFYAEETVKPVDGPTAKQKVLKKIPADVIRNAKGLAIFTTMRTGLWVSGAGGSGVLVGRTADGSWSPPSGIMLHTAGLGFLVGVDIYDCVVVINTQKALDAFAKLRCTVGGEISAVAGPVGAGALLETEVHRRQAPVFTYLKSRGFYAGVQIDGTVVIERTDENERFYNQRISCTDILAGKVRHPPYECERLLQTIKAAQGDKDVDESQMPDEPPPSDLEVDDPTHVFGVPDKEDPDPYGVLALEKEGMSIREAGTQKRASWEQFSFSPAPTSPLFSTFARRSTEQPAKDKRSRVSSSSWHPPTHLGADGDPGTPARATPPPLPNRQSVARSMTDMSTQTDPVPEPLSPGVGSVHGSVHSSRRGSMHEIPENAVAPPSPRPNMVRNPSSRSTRSSPRRSSFRSSHRRTDSASDSRSDSPPQAAATPKAEQHAGIVEESSNDADARAGAESDADDTADEDAVIVEAPVVHSVQKATAPQFISRARLVQVPKRVAPKLPPRNPNRSGPIVIGADPATDHSSPSSPVSASPSPSAAASTAGSTAGSPPPLTKSRPDWGLPSPSNGEPAADPTPSPGEERNPWGRILEKHHRESQEVDKEKLEVPSARKSEDSFDMPGTFHSLPPTPGESLEEPKA